MERGQSYLLKTVPVDLSHSDGDDAEYTPFGWYIGPDGVPYERTWTNIRAGKIPLDDLDDEELSRCELRDEQGEFGQSRRVMRRVPIDYRKYVVARLRMRLQEEFEEAAIRASQVFVDVMEGANNATASEQLRAATYVTERVIGKVPDRLEVSADMAPWQADIAEILIEIPNQQADVLDAEIVDVRRALEA